MAERPVIEQYFVCIGAQKAGTTWLARVLTRHPDVFVTPVKEIHYFDHIAGLTQQLSEARRRSRYRKYYQRLLTQWHKWSEHRTHAAWYRDYMRSPIDDTWYASLFAHRCGKTIAGEVTPEYALIGEKGLRHLKRLAPDARVIYIMRNPVRRAWSQVLHQCRARGIRPERADTAALKAITQEERFEALADDVRVLDALAAVFPPEQLHLAFYEDIHADRLGALERICAFLGVRFDPAAFPRLERRYNPSREAEMPEALRDYLRDKYRAMAQDVARRMGRLPACWQEELALTGPGDRRSQLTAGA